MSSTPPTRGKRQSRLTVNVVQENGASDIISAGMPLVPRNAPEGESGFAPDLSYAEGAPPPMKEETEIIVGAP